MIFDITTLDLGFALACVILVVGVLVKPALARNVVAGMLFVACLSPAYDLGGFARDTWLFPLQERRSEVYLFLALSLVGGLMRVARVRALRQAGPQSGILLLIGLYQGALRSHHDTLGQGLATIAFALSTVGVLMWSLPALLGRLSDSVRLFRSLLCANIAWIGASVVQVFIDPAQLMIADRFAGVTSNAQSAAIVLSMSCVLSTWMAMYEPRRKYRAVWFCLACVNSILLVWTGSRMGTLTLLLGMMVVMRRRFAKRLGWATAALVGAYGLYCLMAGFGLGDVAARLTSTHDSGRGQALVTMLRVGLANPIFGTGIYDAGASENSYLLAFAAFGVGMVCLVLLLAVISLRECVYLWRVARRRRDYGTLSDLTIAFNVMYFTVAMFEGIILARVREALVFMLIFSALSAALRRRCQAVSGGSRVAARYPHGGAVGQQVTAPIKGPKLTAPPRAGLPPPASGDTRRSRARPRQPGGGARHRPHGA